jgi:hypothetical protein
MNQLSSDRRTVGIEVVSDKLWIIAICINCKKRFTSMRAISMHLKITAARHIVNFINYGNYDKKTGLRLKQHYFISHGRNLDSPYWETNRSASSMIPILTYPRY